MSDSSELGTIDPQIVSWDEFRNAIQYSVLDYIHAYKKCEGKLVKEPNNPAFQAMFNKFNPTTLYRFEVVKERARVCAENLLKKTGANFTEIPRTLMDTNKFPSHSQMIDWETAKDIGLNIKHLDPDDEIWRQFWALYCHLKLSIKQNQKIFESRIVSYISWLV